ncbi:MAG: pimeloyl-ACP methyl ester esterase BioH [Gammaproteobacteria bacterium]|nr:pimeloyl-ACP methyl ester esterase BioH [Gammaproteobacteria bacterium]
MRIKGNHELIQKLHISKFGQKNTFAPALLFIHGWGLNSAIWQPLVEILQQDFQVYCLDLPGHGGSSLEAVEFSLEAVAQEAMKIIHAPLYVIGWSLGGQFALKMAELYSEQVLGLLLIANNPRFTTTSNWTAALDRSVLKQFSEQLETDFEKTLQRFLALQVQSGTQQKTSIQFLQRSIQEAGRPCKEGLRVGLKLLTTTDMRTTFSGLKCPLHAILGGRDKLVPIALRHELLRLNKTVKITTIESAAHLPFFSHQDQCAVLIKEFVNDV